MKRKSNKKILYVIPYFAPAWSYGGPVKVSFDFAKELTKMGYHVTVVTTDVMDAKSRVKKLHEKIEGIEIIRFKNVSNYLAKRMNFYMPVGLKKWLETNIDQYDIVHIHEYFAYQSILAGQICRRFNKPYVFQPHGSLFLTARKSRLYNLKNFIIHKCSTLPLGSNAVIVLNEKEAVGTTEVFPEIKSKIKIIPNGLNLNEYHNIKKIDLHKRYHIPSNHKIIVFLGRIHPQKGLDISLKILDIIKRTLDFTFLIIGPDEGEKEHLCRLIKNLGLERNIVFTGLITGNKKLETLKSADLSLLNSRSEGLPTTLLESAALGLPIVCSRESNLPEVEKYNAGFVSSDQKKLVETIKRILQDNQLSSKLSNNSLKLAANFDIKKNAKALSEVYESII